MQSLCIRGNPCLVDSLEEQHWELLDQDRLKNTHRNERRMSSKWMSTIGAEPESCASAYQ
ncbi:hypothetical protein TSUD_317360 [Trifolium subterraneum]|uniref:Uncharacterized protein n=1 Tax=Trifolium subterraneum TaxID=3900 RepID=A0A2Z6M5Z2_TRISU|nr:hypothetical protein TSUD_317360 [Trifolium subterraneum]